MPKIVVLDGHTLNPGDLSWDPILNLGDCTIFDRTMSEDRFERSKEADILVVNKVVLDRPLISNLTNLSFVCVSATGYNNLEISALKDHRILASNVRGYSKESVAQCVFASLLSVLHQPQTYHAEVRDGGWARSADWSYWHESIVELYHKTFGIYGFGQIGQYVGNIARAFNMKVVSHHKHPIRDRKNWVEFVGLDELFRRSDVLSLHAPLGKNNRHLVKDSTLNLMKTTAILINTARGGLVDEKALYRYLKDGRIRAACLDVLQVEPPPANHPLYALDNCHITPHQAWASRESRQRLMDGVVENIKSFLEGNPRNLL